VPRFALLQLQERFNCKLKVVYRPIPLTLFTEAPMLFIPDSTRQRLCTETHHDDALRDQICRMLKKAGLRPTRQRIELGKLLLTGGHRHVTADELHNEALAAGVPHSLATVYNTLNQFVTAGLLRCVNLDGARSFFDTNEADHHHFYIGDDNRVIDIPAEDIGFNALPEPPPGYRISAVEVVIRLERDISRGHGTLTETTSTTTPAIEKQEPAFS